MTEAFIVSQGYHFEYQWLLQYYPCCGSYGICLKWISILFDLTFKISYFFIPVVLNVPPPHPFFKNQEHVWNATNILNFLHWEHYHTRTTTHALPHTHSLLHPHLQPSLLYSLPAVSKTQTNKHPSSSMYPWNGETSRRTFALCKFICIFLCASHRVLPISNEHSNELDSNQDVWPGSHLPEFVT